MHVDLVFEAITGLCSGSGVMWIDYGPNDGTRTRWRATELLASGHHVCVQVATLDSRHWNMDYGILGWIVVDGVMIERSDWAYHRRRGTAGRDMGRDTA
jgi:hypothetical protein